MSTAFGSVRLTVHAAAVSHGSASNLTLYNLDVKSEAVANTASREVRKGAQLQFSYNVPAVTVDSIASTLPHPVRLLKVDVEGHEASVFAGAVQLLTRRAVDVLTFEYGDKMSNTTWRYNKQSQDAAPLSRRGFPRLALFVEWLEGLGYVSFFFGNHVLLPLSGEYWDDNYELCDDRLTAGPFTSGAICWFDILAIRADYRYHATILSRFVHEGALTDGGDCIASHIAKTEHTNANPDAVHVRRPQIRSSLDGGLRKPSASLFELHHLPRSDCSEARCSECIRADPA